MLSSIRPGAISQWAPLSANASPINFCRHWHRQAGGGFCAAGLSRNTQTNSEVIQRFLDVTIESQTKGSKGSEIQIVQV